MVLKGLLVLSLVFASIPGVAAELVGRATVTDGDTLTVAKQRIRLWGIDAPESAQQCTTKDGRSWPCGRRSAAALDSYVLDKTVRCQPKDTDRYGRVVAECFVQGQSVNRRMVSSGWAVAYRQYATAFIGDEADARQHQRNLWQGPFQMPADFRRSKRDQTARQAHVATPPVSSGCRIKGNISRQGKKIYHVPGQRDYERTSIDLSHGERIFCSSEEAARAGWQPAKR
ncbi:thermonuclease family protein [Xanthomonas sacchari]|uniref:Succinoglycan biosynthesis protein n=1 Tax=Xanthomonas sacchari TaxID=56458 RepID=A0A2P5Z1J0_9XANT|nr:thermonuclease family protein [Xanthomonas sacchari]MDV0439819.1 thermonuclease family protein [Xanthomonas sacchari]PPU81318.1 succinoglycan biosynthesis protein [Xanthomonas sacchari]